jgi:PAS domain S-box-containing protein
VAGGEYKQLEERLGQSRRLEGDLRFQAQVLGQVNDAVVAIDDRQRIIYLNRAAERQYDLDGARALGLPLREAYEYRWLRPEDEAAAAEALARTGSWRGENIHVRRDGVALHVESAVSALKNEAGEAAGLLAVIRDVTERRKTEESLRESEERFRAMFEQASVGIVQVTLDGRMHMPNPGFCKLIGYTEDEARRLTVRDVTYPEDYEEEEGLTRRLIRGEIPGFIIEKRYVRKDGQLVWGQMTTSLIRRPSGEPAYALAVIEDISERKRAEERLRASEEHLRAVVESVHDYAIFTLDTEGRVTSWNEGARRLKGYTAGEIVGRPVECFYTREDAAAGKPRREMQTALAAGRSEDESWRMRKDGSLFWANEIVTPLRSDDGTLLGFAKVSRDLTERKELEDALRRAHDELEGRVRERTLELAEANVSLREEVRERRAAEERVKSLLKQLVTVQEEERRRIARELHDTLGQQLAALRLSIDFLKSRAREGAGVTDATERMQSIFDRLNSDVDFLAWELRPASLDMLGLDAALQTFVHEWSGHFGVESTYRCLGLDGSRLPAEVETNLYRILQEALQNVHKHADASRVSVLLERRDGHAVLIVEDNGRGYDPDGEVAAGSNKGMGVVNMRERTALVGGYVEIESTPGAGTTIFVRVPLGGPDGEGGGL